MSEKQKISSHIGSITIEDEMRRSYLSYAMSVIVSRALPDVRDGLKPVHRRILYAMLLSGCTAAKDFVKSARIVGEVMGKYHPHGDSAIYDSMVRMAQDFSLRVPLVSGQGNFGSIDGDSPAAMRYTEARLARVSEMLLNDIDKDTVDFVPNYDETLKEPTVLPASFPNILVNGSGGIAVGMATNIPPHNLGEIINACIACIDNPKIQSEDLYAIVPGPDFPTGGIIIGKKGRQSACATGRGSLLVRSKTSTEVIGNKDAIVVTEIPYQVNKSRLIVSIAEAVKNGLVDGVADLRDESDRKGIRIVIEIKRDCVTAIVLSNLLRHTPLQTTFGVNTLAINDGRPELLNLRSIIAAFIQFREKVILRRSAFDLDKTRKRAHILMGLLVAVNNIDKVLNCIRSAKNTAAARDALMGRMWEAEDIQSFISLLNETENIASENGYRLSERQARAILELRLQRLTGMERAQIKHDMIDLSKRIKRLSSIVSLRRVRMKVMKDDLVAIRDQFATDRKTQLVDAEFEYRMEDLIQREEMVVTVTHSGYIKRVPLSTYRAQHRGGKGRSGMQTKEDDFLVEAFVQNTHTSLLMFSSIGKCYGLKVYDLPLGSAQSKGKALINLLPLEKKETIATILPLPQNLSADKSCLMFATSKGSVRRNLLSDFTNVRVGGKIAMKIGAEDKLINVLLCSEDDDALLASKNGMAVRFPVTDVRIFVGRSSVGVRGISLKDGDSVISMTMVRHVEATVENRKEYITAKRAHSRTKKTMGAIAAEDEKKMACFARSDFQKMQHNESFILTVSTNGYGQLASSYDYSITKRGGKGIVNMEMRNKAATVAGSLQIKPKEDQIILVTQEGQIIRMPTDKMRVISRNSKGVRLFRMVDGRQKVVAVARLCDL